MFILNSKIMKGEEQKTKVTEDHLKERVITQIWVG